MTNAIMKNNWSIKTAAWTASFLLAAGMGIAQEDQAPPPPPPKVEKPGATVGAEIGEDGGGTIVVEARGMRPKVPVFFSGQATANVTAGVERITQEIRLDLKVVQGEAETLSL